MQKPATVVREELKQNIIKAINDSNLPAFAISDILEKLLTECRQLEQQQYEQDKRTYEASLEAEVEE